MSTIGVVMAGGASRRMGVDKLSLPVLPGGDTTILEHVVNCVYELADMLYVTHAPRPSFSCGEWAFELEKKVHFIQDETWYHGPLGVLARLDLAMPKAEFVMIVAGDLPGLHQSVLRACLDRLHGVKDVDAALVERDGMIQPLLGCYRRDALSVFFEAWQHGETRLMSIMEKLEVERIVAEKAVWPAWWTRPVHTPEDYAMWKSEWRGYHAT